MEAVKPRPILVIGGPTAAGKTAASLMLSQHVSMEIISADSRQVYRDLDIGTAKPSRAELGICKHHCIDTLDPAEPYTAADYATEVRSIIDSTDKNKLLVMVGGSGLYITAALDGLSEDTGPMEPELRRQLQTELSEKGRDLLYMELKDQDPKAAEAYSDRNPRRIIRALAHMRSTGQKFSDTWDTERDAPNVEAMYVCLSPRRDLLVDRIEERCEQMLSNGIVEETERILSSGVSEDAQCFRTVGYREVIDHLNGKTTRDEMLELMKISSRQYAKRQRTWFRRDERYSWIENDPNEPDQVVVDIITRMRSNASFAPFVDSDAA